MLIKSLVEENFAMRGKLIKLGQIHRDRELFLSYLFGQQPIEEPALPGDLRLGNSEARLQITAVLSFACDICGESFATLARLVRTHPHAIGVTVRFAVEHQPGSSKCKLLAQMLAHAIENRILDDGTKIERMIADWFSHKNFDLFLAQYPASDSTAIRASIDAQATWCKEAQIVSTPVLFINGYRLRRPYDVDDLPEHYAALVETVETMEEQPQAQPYSRAV